MTEGQVQRSSPSKTERRHRSPRPRGLFVTDEELPDVLGIPAHEAAPMIRALDQNPNSRFPKKQQFWGYRRYLPAVQEWLKEAHGLKISDPQRRSS